MKLFPAALLLLIIPASLASSTCPCSQPGSPGTLIGFDCAVGDAVNISLYTNQTPEIGSMEIWALKRIGQDLVPARNLAVYVISPGNSTSILTDENGYFKLDIPLPGYYELRGGDATLNFTVQAPAEDGASFNDSAQASNSGSEIPLGFNASGNASRESRDASNSSATSAEAGSCSSVAGGRGPDFILIALAAAAGIALILLRPKR